MDEKQIHELIKEFYVFSNYTATVQAIEEEQKTKPTQKLRKAVKNLTEEDLEKLPRLFQLAQTDRERSVKEANLEKHIESLEKNYNIVLQTAQQVYSIATDACDKLGGYVEHIEAGRNYSEQLEKFQHLIMMDKIGEDDTAISESTILDIKDRLYTATDIWEIDEISEVLVELRANCLISATSHRRQVVDMLIENDVLAGNGELYLKTDQPKLIQSTLSILSIISSTQRGVRQILKTHSETLIPTLIGILLKQKSNSVSQRFAIATLQKIWCFEDQIWNQMIEAGLMQWVSSEVLGQQGYVSSFVLDYGSALLSNLLLVSYSAVYLESRPNVTLELFRVLINKLEQDLDSVVVVHVLISLTWLANERYFSAQMDEVNFYDHISEFVEKHSTTRTEDEDSRKTILDMCAHLFHERNNSSRLDTSEVMEYNTQKHQAEIKELEKRMEDETTPLVFEHFPDEAVIYRK